MAEDWPCRGVEKQETTNVVMIEMASLTTVHTTKAYCKEQCLARGHKDLIGRNLGSMITYRCEGAHRRGMVDDHCDHHSGSHVYH